MRKFILTTQDEGGDFREYYIKHPQEPTFDELTKFAKVNVVEEHYDAESDTLYETPLSMEEITEDLYKTIPE